MSDRNKAIGREKVQDRERPANSQIGKAFPLLRIFFFVLLPVLVVGSIGLAVTLNNAISASAETLFAQQEIRLVKTMLLADGVLGTGDSHSAATLTELGKELGESGISCLVVMKTDGTPVVRIDGGTSCASVKPADFEDVSSADASVLVEDLVALGHWTSLGSIELPGVRSAAPGGRDAAKPFPRGCHLGFGMVLDGDFLHPFRRRVDRDHRRRNACPAVARCAGWLRSWRSPATATIPSRRRRSKCAGRQLFSAEVRSRCHVSGPA